MKPLLHAAVTVVAVCAFANSAFANTIGTFGVATLAQGGSQGCGAQAIYDTTDGGKLGSSTTPSNFSIHDCQTTILKGTTAKGEKAAFGQTAQQAKAGDGSLVASSDYSTAGLARGTERGFADTKNGYSASGDQSLWDMLTFKIPGATSSTVTEIELNFTVSGKFQDPSGNSFVSAEAQVGTTTPCDCTHGNDVQWGINRSDIGRGPGFFTENSSFVTWKVLSSSTSGVKAQGTITLQGANPTLGLVTRVILDPSAGPIEGEQGALLDYTGAVSLSLPKGVTFTSASGVFLTAPPPTPIPTKKPTATPTKKPTPTATKKPTPIPTRKPTATPTKKNPTPTPTKKPTPTHTRKPTATPTHKPA